MENNSFEEKMKKLNEIVEKLSDESVSLNDSLNLYVEGKELIKELQKLDGELRVFASADMMDVYNGEIIGVDVNDIEVNCIKGKK